MCCLGRGRVIWAGGEYLVLTTQYLVRLQQSALGPSPRAIRLVQCRFVPTRRTGRSGCRGQRRPQRQRKSPLDRWITWRQRKSPLDSSDGLWITWAPGTSVESHLQSTCWQWRKCLVKAATCANLHRARLTSALASTGQGSPSALDRIDTSANCGDAPATHPCWASDFRCTSHNL